jgi:hypothetical protein
MDHYLAVLKASYDYDPDPGADEEIAIKENQILFLKERVDAEYLLSLHVPVPQSHFLAAGGRSRSRATRRRTTVPLALSPPHTSSPCVGSIISRVMIE